MILNHQYSERILKSNMLQDNFEMHTAPGACLLCCFQIWSWSIFSIENVSDYEWSRTINPGQNLQKALKEAIWIRRKGNNTLNIDKGAYKFNNIFDQLIHATPSIAASSSYKRIMLSVKSCKSEETAS